VNIFSEKQNPVIQEMAGNNKLPSENKVREYLDQFITPDTDALSVFMPSVEQLITKELTKKPLAPDKYRYHEGPGKWPINVGKAWIARSFGHNLDNCPKPELQRKDEEEIDKAFYPYLASSLPEEFRKRLEECKPGFCHIGTDRQSKGRNFRIDFRMNNAFSNYHEIQLRELHTSLRDKGFIRVRSEPRLRQEILTRRAQYPKWKVYTLLGGMIVEYFGSIYNASNWNGSSLIFTTRALNGLDEYESAVFAECQIRASHEFLFHSHPHRVPRWWELHYASVMKFSLEVDEHTEEKKELRGKPSLTSLRFSNLE